ncbi:MAG TPA: DNA-processing protein DprA [Candidatus Paceibacterota bacterium]
MKHESDLASWITLTQIPGLGSEGLRRLLSSFGSPDAIFALSSSALQNHVKPAVAKEISRGIKQEAVEQVFEWLDDPSNDIVTIADTDYPQSLLNTADPPLLLYLKGRRELLNNPSLAVVGSRNATAQGMRNAESFSEAAGHAGLCIVSGLAHGIDTAAHGGGLRAGASSIAVVGTGLDKVYPAANRNLAHELGRRGALVSEFPLGTPPLAANFPRRNRIISGLSLGCLVIEASLQSGSLITARLALEQGREVFAIPGSIHAPQSKGCHALIKQGAKLVDHVNDILDELKFSPVAVSQSVSPASHAVHPLFDHLGYEPVDIDTLSALSGLTIDQLSAILLELELEGRVAAVPGGFYQRLV